MLKIRPEKKESIVNPLTSLLVKNTNKALIIKVNKPKVTTLIGKVRMTKIGLTTMFKHPKPPLQ